MTWEPLLQEVTGIDLTGTPATLPGHALKISAQFGLPSLRAGDGDVPGLLLYDLPDAAQDRIAFFAKGFGFDPVSRSVDAGGRTIDATTFEFTDLESGAADWSLEAWRTRWGQITLNAAREIGQHVGQVSTDNLVWMLPMIMVRAAARVAAASPVPTDIRSDLAAGDVSVKEENNRHAGFFLTREFLLQHPTFDGGQSVPVRREVFVATDAAIVLPYDPVRDRVLLVEQFRMGPYGRGDPHPWMLEPVAGRVDPGEDPAETARRECVEEAGLTLSGLEHISSHYCSPGCSTEYFHCYLGLCELPDMARGQGGLESENEDIRTHILAFPDALALIETGEAANGPLVACLLWLQRERERLRADA